MATTVNLKALHCDSPISLEVGPDVLGPGEVPEDDLPLGLHDLLRLAGRVVLPQQRQGVRHGCGGDTGTVDAGYRATGLGFMQSKAFRRKFIDVQYPHKHAFNP